MGLTVFFDTYAMCEIVLLNPNYSKFKEGYSVVITKYNLMELFYGLFLKYGRDVADIYYDRYNNYCIDIDDETIKEAMIFRAKNRSKRLSYVDSLGYTLALKRGIPFVTGDEQFKGMPNVEFLK